MLKLEPVEIPDGFRWRTQFGHLTYSAHIPHEQLVILASSITSIHLKGWSIVHETGADGHAHTHFAWMFNTKLDLLGARMFDTLNVKTGTMLHPHMQPKLSAASMESLFNEYHLGRKYDTAAGKKMYTAPTAGPWQKLPPEFQWAREVMKDVVEAPTLQEAVILAGIRPRSVMDVQLLRRDSQNAPKKFKHLFPNLDSFKVPLLPTDWRCLHICGATGLGKTKLACAFFKSPLFIKPFNAIGCLEMLARFDSRVHDGIVCDESDCRGFSREQMIALTDFDEDGVISVRYTKIEMPAGVRKVFVSNIPDIWPASDKEIGAIARRVTKFHATARLF